MQIEANLSIDLSLSDEAQIRLDPSTGTTWWRLGNETDGWRQLCWAIQVEGRRLMPSGGLGFVQAREVDKGHQVRLAFSSTDPPLEVTVDLRVDQSALLTHVTIHNTGNRPVKLDRVDILDSPQGLAGSDDWRIYVDSGGSWCGVKRLNVTSYDPVLAALDAQRLDDEVCPETSFHHSNLQTVLYDAGRGIALLLGFLSCEHAEGWIDVYPDSSGRQIAAVEAFGEHPELLQADQTWYSDPLCLIAGHDPLALMERYARRVRDCAKPVLPSVPIVGYMSWYGYRTQISEQIILDGARFCAEMFAGYPQPMDPIMLIDHGWEPNANWGTWNRSDPKRFPHGMAWLAEQLSQFGLRLGLWYTPFCITDDCDDFDQIAALMSKDVAGRPVQGTAGVWNTMADPRLHGRRPIWFLDSALPEVRSRYANDLALMKEWGTSFWKLDFFAVRTSEGNQAEWPLVRLNREVWEAFRKVLAEDDLLMPCSSGTNMHLGKCNLINIPRDTGNAAMWPKELPWFRSSFSTVAANWHKHRTFWANDHQSVQVGEGCSLGEARIRAGMIALCGGGLWLSEDVVQLPPDRVHLVRRCLPVYGRAARPVNLFDAPYPDGYPNVWALPVKTDWAGSQAALGIFNLSEKTLAQSVDPAWLRLEANAEFTAFEWWNCRWLGRHLGPFAVDVPPLDMAILHASATREHPWVVSTDLHYAPSWILQDVAWDEKTCELSGKLATKSGLIGTIFGTCPESYNVISGTQQAARANRSGGWQLKITTTGTRTPFRVRFEKEGR